MSQESSSPSNPKISEDQAQALLLGLRQKQGNWVDWGVACHQLQQGGYDSLAIFEATGFEASQQNLVIVAAQVYNSMVKAGGSEALQAYFTGPKSDVVYELRLLNQDQRLAAGQVAMDKKLDVDEAHQLVKAIKDFSRLSQPPMEFTRHPGDAVAYQCWKAARSKKDIQDRSRLIARGLKFAHSDSARQLIERLLTDFTVVPSRQAPLLAIHRLEQEEELPLILPMAGSLALTATALQQVPKAQAQEPFRIVGFSGAGAWVPIPGWPVVLKAADPVALVTQSNRLPLNQQTKVEEVLVIVDRGNPDWNIDSYFLVAGEEQLEIQWFEEAPESPLLGRVILVLRPKNILDENVITEPWQMDD
jgi:hypothetical protein